MKKYKALFYVLSVVSAFCIICVVAALAINSGTSSSSVLPTEKVSSTIADTLGSSNRNVQRLSALNWSDGDKTLTIKWAINDNLSESMIKRGAMLDITNVLKLISKQGIPYDYQTIVFDGTFPLQDVYGNASEERVVLVSFQRSTIAKINWDNFITDNIYKIADSVWLHPSFQ